MKLRVSVIILTFNEEKNIEDCLRSVQEWAGEIFVVDSHSTDRTVEIAKKYTDKIYQHSFEDYSKQRNWTQDNCQIANEWILHLDADERITKALAHELKNVFLNINDDVGGFLIKKRVIFLGRWIKHGAHSAYRLTLFRKNKGRCEKRKYDQHFVCSGKTLKLRHDIAEENNISIAEWIERHNRWSSLEAEQIFSGEKNREVKEKIFGTPIEKRRWLKNKVFIKLPLFIRSLLYFIYRYFLRLGFLDGKEGLIFHFLQGFWFRFLVDAKIYEHKKATKKQR